MRKLLISILCGLLIFSCCACENKKLDERVENSEPPVKEVEISENVTLTLKGKFLDEYADVEGLDISKFLGTAIVKVRPEEYQNQDIPVITKDDTKADLVFTLMHLNPEYLEEYAISVSENNTRAYTVAIVKAKPNFEEELTVGYSQRLEDLSKSMKNYPDQMYLLEHIKLEQIGDYLVLIVCDNAEEVYNQIYNVMEKLDLDLIEPVPLMTDEEREQIEKDALNKELSAIDSEVEDVIVTSVEEPVVQEVDDNIEADDNINESNGNVENAEPETSSTNVNN